MGADQRIDVGDYKVVLGVDTQYRSGRYIGFEYLAAQYVGGTWQSNARIAFGPRSDRWSIGAFVQNIENDRYALNKFLDTIPNALTRSSAPPRTYGLRLSAKY